MVECILNKYKHRIYKSVLRCDKWYMILCFILSISISMWKNQYYIRYLLLLLQYVVSMSYIISLLIIGATRRGLFLVSFLVLFF